MENFNWTNLTNQRTEVGKRLIISELTDIKFEGRYIKEAYA